MKRIIYITLCVCMGMIARETSAQTRKVLKMKKEGQEIYSIALDKVNALSVSDTWNFLGIKGKSLFREMLSRPELTTFVQVIRSAGYDFVLDAPSINNSYYHVVAPTNSALSFVTQEDLLDSTYMRDLAREYIAVDQRVEENTITFLSNNKVARSFGDPTPCHNGALYSISKLVTRPAGILDLLTDEPELSWFYESLNAYEVCDQGSEVVLTNDLVSNRLANFMRIGAATTTLIPAESVYNAFIKQYEHLFQVPEFLSVYKDAHPLFRFLTLEGRYTSYAGMPESLTVANSGQKVAKSCLKPVGNPLVAMDGVVFPLSEMPFSITDLYRPIVTEAENNYRLFRVGINQVTKVLALNTDTLTVSPLSTDYETLNKKYKVSNSAYFSVKQSAAQCATATFGVSGTFSGSYDVWVTFIPGFMVDGVTPLSASVSATVTYAVLNEGGVSSKNLTVPAFKIDPYAVTRVKIARLSDLDICFDGFLSEDEYLYTDPDDLSGTDSMNKKYGVKIQLRNTTSIIDKATDHNLYIDCIELVPVTVNN